MKRTSTPSYAQQSIKYIENYSKIAIRTHQLCQSRVFSTETGQRELRNFELEQKTRVVSVLFTRVCRYIKHLARTSVSL